MVRKALEYSIRPVAHNAGSPDAQVNEEPVVASRDGGAEFVDNALAKFGLLLVRAHLVWITPSR
jgi:hypothetical protein